MNKYGSVFIPFLGLKPIRSRIMFAVVCVFALMSEIGFIASPVNAMLNKLVYTTMIVSPARQRPTPLNAPEVKVQRRENETKVVLEFSDCTFEFRHRTGTANGELPFSVEKLKTTKNNGG